MIPCAGISQLAPARRDAPTSATRAVRRHHAAPDCGGRPQSVGFNLHCRIWRRQWQGGDISFADLRLIQLRSLPVADQIMTKTKSHWGPAPRRQIDAPKTLADEAYQRIHDDIIRGAFAPNDKLQPDALRERYDIGLSPLREALSRVALEGLAIAEGQRGFFVAPATREELLDIADLRINFSVLSLERSIRDGGDEWENAVVTTYYQLNKLENQAHRDSKTFHDEWERRNRDFHQALESGCGSPWLLHFCDILYDQL